MTIELTDRPASAKGLIFIVPSGIQIRYREQPHVVRPRKRENRHVSQTQFRRRRLRYLRGDSCGRIRRQCLRIHPLEIELSHLLQISFRESPTKPGLQIPRQPLQQFRAVNCPLLTALFKLHETPPHQPVRCGQDCVDRLRSVLASTLEEFRDVRQQRLISSGHFRA